MKREIRMVEEAKCVPERYLVWPIMLGSTIHTHLWRIHRKFFYDFWKEFLFDFVLVFTETKQTHTNNNNNIF